MPKLNLVPGLRPPHSFTPIKNCQVAPIVHFPAEQKPNRISDSGPFTTRIKIIHTDTKSFQDFIYLLQNIYLNVFSKRSQLTLK